VRKVAGAYYRDVLGFTVNYAQHDLGVMDRDDVHILLIAQTAQYKGIRSRCGDARSHIGQGKVGMMVFNMGSGLRSCGASND
jgi:hypothetical protein